MCNTKLDRTSNTHRIGTVSSLGLEFLLDKNSSSKENFGMKLYKEDQTWISQSSMQK